MSRDLKHCCGPRPLQCLVVLGAPLCICCDKQRHWLAEPTAESGELDPGVSFPGTGSSAALLCTAIHRASGAASARSTEGHRKPQ